MITCFLRYEIDITKIAEFEHYGRLWIRLVNKMGGRHHGYLSPSEGASDVALASFTFPSLMPYEQYRQAAATDPKAPVWIPRSDAGYFVVTCTECLRSFSVPDEELNDPTEVREAQCDFCQMTVRYLHCSKWYC
jgi:hypothetical protein